MPSWLFRKYILLKFVFILSHKAVPLLKFWLRKARCVAKRHPILGNILMVGARRSGTKTAEIVCIFILLLYFVFSVSLSRAPRP